MANIFFLTIALVIMSVESKAAVGQVAHPAPKEIDDNWPEDDYIEGKEHSVEVTEETTAEVKAALKAHKVNFNEETDEVRVIQKVAKQIATHSEGMDVIADVTRILFYVTKPPCQHCVGGKTSTSFCVKIKADRKTLHKEKISCTAPNLALTGNTRLL